MGHKVIIENVILRGDDLNFQQSPYRRVNKANSLRLLPVALGAFGSAAAISLRLILRCSS